MSPRPTIAHYRITAKLGEGGMGAVYRATDTKLNRDVAIKMLPDAFAADPDRVARFTREAQALAALNHPNIAMIFGIEENALVLELVEGATLDERIAQGRIPLEEALGLARQIASALEAAHEKGIVHRDLKPANIKITPEGKVKVLDFGLAKVLDTQSNGPGALTDSPTLTLDATRAGVIVGTVGYMSPEQARGKAADKRADIWSFGVVLFEMVTGRRLFSGDTISDAIAAVLRQEPDFDAAPAKARTLLRRCLERDPQKRLRDIGDMELLLADHSTAARARRGWLWPGIAALAMAAAATVSLLHFRERLPAAEVVRFEIEGPSNHTLNDLSLSPDGRQIAFIAVARPARNQLWVRNLDSLESHLLPGTDGAQAPFWSPDGRFVAFKAGGKLKKIAVSGGPPQTLCDAPGEGFAHGAWNRDDVILFASGAAGLMRVPASGGVPAPVTAPDASGKQVFHRRPTFLPDGRRFLYFRSAPGLPAGGYYVGSLDLPPERQASQPILTTDKAPVFVATSDPSGGQLLFLREGTLMAQRFDIRRLELVGHPEPIAPEVSTVGTYGFFSVSENGVLAYRSSRAAVQFQVTWYDRHGTVSGTVGEFGPNSLIALAPDGSKAAVTRRTPADIWLLDFERSTDSRFTFNPGSDSNPVWSPDGKEIAFVSSGNGTSTIYRKSSSGATEEQALISSGEFKYLFDWSQDGGFLLYGVQGAKGSDLWILPLAGDRKPFPFLATEFGEGGGAFSPDGRWIAYVSNESGSNLEVYVRPFPSTSNGGAKWQVSNGGGYRPRWRRDGKELFFASSRDLRLMSVEVSGGAVFHAGVPRRVFEAPMRSSLAGWDVTADGQRFVVLQRAESNPVAPPITVVLNWPSALAKH